MPNREVISIHLGRAGVQVGSACWKLYCLEHGIMPDGSYNLGQNDEVVGNFFSGFGTNKLVPRALFVDLEPTVVDHEIRTGAYRQIYHPEQLVTGKEDAANNYARGHYTVGKEIVDMVLDKLRKLVDNCDAPQGFLIYNGVGGGTGSGLGALLSERLRVEYRKKSKLAFTVYPGPQLQTSILEPYNSFLNRHGQMENVEVQFAFDNEAMFNICKSRLDIERPTVANINPLIARVSSSMTQSLRFDGELNVDLNEFQTNLIPFPTLHTIVPAFAPLVTPANVSHAALDAQSLTDAWFDAGNQMVKCNPLDGKVMSASLMYRGPFTPRDVSSVVSSIKALYGDRFADWVPTGVKTGISRQSPVAFGSDLAAADRDVCMLSNTTAIAKFWARLTHKFDLMYAKRAFVHQYVGEGMEEGEFSEARESMAFLEKDFKDLEGGEADEEEDGEWY